MAVCRSCGADLPPAARYCARCGVRVATLASDERKVVTVLFADIAASTAIGAERDPEDARAVIQPQLALMRDELSRHGGTIEKYVGDAVMAVFGAPISHEDDPERAVRAALAIRDALGTKVRVAVNTGEAVVALAAEPEAGEGFVAGDVVNTAFRIEEATPDGAVCVGESTYRATVETIEYGERRLVTAKGKQEPLAVWEAIRAPSEPRAAVDGPPLAAFVGRKEELALILDTLARAKRDRTVQLVTIVGVPGIGKSRLVWELQRALEDEPRLVTWRRGRCLPYGDGVTYWALGEMVKTQAGVLETDDAPTAVEKLAHAVRELLSDPAEATWVEAQLRPLLALDVATAERREEPFAAWRRFFEALADWGPLVLAFDDLHWADEGLLDFIEHVADWGRDAPLLLLCTARPELLDRRRGWGARANALTIALPPLNEDETARLVSLLLRQTVPEELRDTILARAEGNPLYAEEFVRMLVDRGLLVRDDGAWTLRATELPVPESVQGIIASRLDALGADDKALLHAAAVVGRTFWPSAVAAVAGAALPDVHRSLPALDRRELLIQHRQSAVGGEPQYAFRHVLVRDAAYGQIPRARRADKHLLAAEWVESLGRPEDHAETLAHHYLAALEYAKATGQETSLFAERARLALREAGERALALNAYAAAASFFGGALELWPEDDTDRPILLFSYGKALSRGPSPDERLLMEARDSLIAVDDVEHAAECEVIVGELLWMRGHREEAFERLVAGVQMLEGQAASYSKAYALSRLSRLRIAADEAEAAIELARAAMEIADELGLDGMRAHVLNTIGVARITRGDRGGIADLERSIAIAEAANSPEIAIGCYFNLGSMLANVGDLRRASELHAEGRRLAERIGDVAFVEWHEAERVYETYWSADWDAALDLAEKLIAIAETGVSRRPTLDGSLVRGWIALARGDVVSALEDAERAHAFSRVAGDPQNLYPALAFRAHASLAAGRRDEAAQAVDALLERMAAQPSLPSFWVFELAVVLAEMGRGGDLAEASARLPRTRWLDAARAYVGGDLTRAADVCAEIGALPEEAYARVAAACAALAEGRREESEDHLAAALAFYRRVGAASYGHRAEALLTP